MFSTALLKVSNPAIVKMKAKKLFGSDVKIVESKTKNKKYALIKPDGKRVNFGHIDYKDFTKHKDKKRKDNYLKRATKIKGNWKVNKYSPNNLSIKLLWDGK
jgi:hypothetical protein